MTKALLCKAFVIIGGAFFLIIIKYKGSAATTYDRANCNQCHPAFAVCDEVKIKSSASRQSIAQIPRFIDRVGGKKIIKSSISVISLFCQQITAEIVQSSSHKIQGFTWVAPKWEEQTLLIPPAPLYFCPLLAYSPSPLSTHSSLFHD